MGSGNAIDDEQRRWDSVDSVLQVARAAEVLARRGAREPALILYNALARKGVVMDVADDVALSLEERMSRARAELASWLRRELGGELDGLRAVARRARRFAVAAVLTTVGVLYVASLHRRGELSEGAHWTVSSTWDKTPSSGVLPKHGFFFSPPAYFFHTLAEERPWVSIDLGSERLVTSMEIHNRLDGCGERARALVVEVSQDGLVFQHLRSHARRDEKFREWKPRFSPVRARYVRIVGTANENLHLSDVRIFGS